MAAREEAAEKAAQPLVWLQVLAALVAAAIGALAVGTFGLGLVGEALGAAGGSTEASVTPLVVVAIAGLLAAGGWGWWMRAAERQ
ncbi:MAG TPA: hypothetical protein VKU40_01085 [Thermoanaerobaculia bacterium]|nr:hypothetical protein [Thermoanaerobaculia bacterium]